MKRLDTRDASNRKWRTVERPARRDGQRDYRVIFAVIAAALLILAIDAVLIMIRVQQPARILKVGFIAICVTVPMFFLLALLIAGWSAAD